MNKQKKADGKKRKLCVIFLCICFLSLGACTQKKQEEVELNRKVLPMMEGGGVSYGLYGLDGEIEETDIFQADPDGKFEKILSVGNYNEEAFEVSMIVLKNFEQISFEVSGTEYLSYDFDVPAGGANQVQFVLDDIKNKNTNICVLLFQDLNNHSSQIEFREKTDLTNLFAYSCIVNGKAEEKFITYENSAPFYGKKENRDINAILLNTSKDGLERCLQLTSDELKNEQLYMHIGNASPHEKEYALVMFDGKKIYPINGKKVMYLTVKPYKMAHIPIDVKYLNTNEIHELTVVRIEMIPNSKVIQIVDNTIRVGVNLK